MAECRSSGGLDKGAKIGSYPKVAIHVHHRRLQASRTTTSTSLTMAPDQDSLRVSPIGRGRIRASSPDDAGRTR